MNKRIKTGSIMNAIFIRTVYLMTLIQLSRVGAQFVDSFVMSRAYGRTAIDAAGLAGPYFTVTSLIAGLISTGCQSICGRSLGAGDIEKIKNANEEKVKVLVFPELSLTGVTCGDLHFHKAMLLKVRKNLLKIIREAII